MSQADGQHSANLCRRYSDKDAMPSGVSQVHACGKPLQFPAFVAVRSDPRPGEFLRDFWSVQESGNWPRDVATGRDHARDALCFMREERMPHVLNWIVSEMIHKRHFGPIEVGFFHELGAIVLRTRRAAR